MLSSAALDRCGGSRAGARARSGRPHISGEWLPPNTKAVLGLVAGNKLADVLEVVEREVTGPHFGEERGGRPSR
jgi:hypothetical protein